MSQLIHGNSASTTYGMYDSVARRSRLLALRVYAPANRKECVQGSKRGGEGRKREIKRVTKVAPIALSAPFLGDLLRFCRNPIALSAIKPESCPVKGWYGGRRAKTESVTIGEERGRERERGFSPRRRVEERGW